MEPTQKKSNMKLIIEIVVAIIILIAGYYFVSTINNNNGQLTTNTSTLNALSSDFVVLSKAMKSNGINLDSLLNKVLDNEFVKGTRDYTINIERTTDRGRNNPFLPY